MRVTPLFLSMQLANPWAGWIHITKDQSPGGRWETQGTQGLRVDTCQEAAFESTGMDFISESQFEVIVLAVVNRTGEIQRFRITDGPPTPTNVDLAKPIQRALAAWRIRLPEVRRSGETFEFAIVLPKALGAMQTSACAPVKPEK